MFAVHAAIAPVPTVHVPDAPCCTTRNLVVRCPGCRSLLYRKDWLKQWRVCQHCGHHFRIAAWELSELLLDTHSFCVLNHSQLADDPSQCCANLLPVRLLRSAVDVTQNSKLSDIMPDAESISQGATPDEFSSSAGCAEVQKICPAGRDSPLPVFGAGTIAGLPLLLIMWDRACLGSESGSVAIDQMIQIIELARASQIPLLLVVTTDEPSAGSGASILIQTATIAPALARLAEAGVLYISLLSGTLTGDLVLSFALLGDIILAEPGTQISFAGTHIPLLSQGLVSFVWQESLLTAEDALAHGMLDAVVPRRQLRATLGRLLLLHAPSARRAR
jgi:acetyl-CoA carboxylase beta subunit